MRLLARRDRIDNNSPRAAGVRRIRLFRVLNHSIVVTAVAQIGLNLVGVSPERGFRITAAGLE